MHYGGGILNKLDENTEIASIYGRRQVATPRWLTCWAPNHSRVYIDATATHFQANGDDSKQLAIGPVIVWRAPDAPWRLAGGFQPTLISDHELGNRALGGAFQFTSHLAAGIELGERAVVELQWRHTSNADLYDKNDGIDVQILNLGWRY